MQALIGRLKQLLMECVQTNSPSGLLLSGGLDSAILAAIQPSVTAITVSLNPGGEDIYYANTVTQFFQIRHVHRNVDVNEALAAIPDVITILRSFDPALPNDLTAYLGLKVAKDLRLKAVMTGDGSDELFAGYTFMQEIDDLSGYIQKIVQNMNFSSNAIGEMLGINIVQPFMAKAIIDLALQIPVELKLKKQHDAIWGKWILRKAFEDVLPEKVVWQSKRPLEYGSGMTRIREIISAKMSDAEFDAVRGSSPIKFMNKEHAYYYQIYQQVIGEIPRPVDGEKACPGCGAGLHPAAFHCKICGYVMNWRI